MKPDTATSVIETDMEVDFEAPPGHAEREAERKREAEAAAAAAAGPTAPKGECSFAAPPLCRPHRLPLCSCRAPWKRDDDCGDVQLPHGPARGRAAPAQPEAGARRQIPPVSRRRPAAGRQERDSRCHGWRRRWRWCRHTVVRGRSCRCGHPDGEHAAGGGGGEGGAVPAVPGRHLHRVGEEGGRSGGQGFRRCSWGRPWQRARAGRRKGACA